MDDESAGQIKAARLRGLKADDVGDSDAKQRRKQHRGNQEDDDQAHKGGSAFGKFGDAFNQFSLISGVLLHSFLERGKFVLEAAEGAFLLAGVEGKGTVIGLEMGDGVFQWLKVHFVHRPVVEQIGGSGDYVAFEQGQHLANQGQHGLGDADSAIKSGGFLRLGHGARECGGNPFSGGFFWRGLTHCRALRR